MAQAAKAQEPSMEEILASIRRIIADDEPKPAEPPKAAAKPAPAPPPPAAARPAPPPPAPPPPAPAPEPVASTSDPDINALLAEIGESPLQEPEPEPAPAEPDILELTEDMAQIEPAAFQTVEPQEEVIFEDPAPEPEPEPAYDAAPAYQSMPELSQQPPLMSPSTMNAVGSAFNSLARTVLTDNARTLEDLVREMLRPMLKGWLDDNLPGMVERIVRSEIERVSRGR